MVLLGDVGQVEAYLDPFEDSFNPVQDRCTVCDECMMGMEIALGTPDGSPRKCSQVEACFSPFGDSVSLGARLVHGLRRTYHRLENHFGRTRWYSLVMWVK
jgi:hypothetical protein